MAGEKGLREFSVYSCGNGFLGDLDLYAFGDPQDETVVLDAGNGAENTSYGFDLGPFFKGLDHFLVLLLLLALRGNEQKPEGDED